MPDGIKNFLKRINIFDRPPKEPIRGPVQYVPMRSSSRSYRYIDSNTLKSIINRIVVDATDVMFHHANMDKDGRYIGNVTSGLERCLTVFANVDQEATHFRQDVYERMLEDGHAAIVPIEYTKDTNGNLDDVQTLRVGKVVKWYPRHVTVDILDDREDKGEHREITLAKDMVAIVTNPFYNIMNTGMGTLARLNRKLALLDEHDENGAAGKLNIIVQLPYAVRGDARRAQAANRRTELEAQLVGSTHGIAYTDASEKVIQLNRAVDNNLFEQVKILTEQLYTQLGVTASVINGTADPSTMTNYYTRVVDPHVVALREALIAKFISEARRNSGETVMTNRDMFKYMPMDKFGELADVLSRNEIASANEIRTILRWSPASDPGADLLRNSNMPQPGYVPTEQVVEQVNNTEESL